MFVEMFGTLDMGEAKFEHRPPVIRVETDKLLGHQAVEVEHLAPRLRVYANGGMRRVRHAAAVEGRRFYLGRIVVGIHRVQGPDPRPDGAG